MKLRIYLVLFRIDSISYKALKEISSILTKYKEKT